MSTDPAPSGARIPHLMVGRELRRIPALNPDDVDYSVTTACGLDRNVTLVTSDRAQVRCPACRTAAENAAAEAEGRSAETTVERSAMVNLAIAWEGTARDLHDAIFDGASASVVEVDTLRQCAAELRSTLEAGRPGGSSPGTEPAPGADPLAHVTVGEPQPETETAAIREAARRLRASADACGAPGSFHATKLSSVADTFDVWAESDVINHPYRKDIVAAARVILGSAD